MPPRWSSADRRGRYLINLDTQGRKLEILVDSGELDARRRAWVAPPPYYERGFGALHVAHVLQADEGCDLDFLETGDAAPVPEPDIY